MDKRKKIRNILVIKPSSLGDILHVFPALQLLKEQYPEASLDFFISPAFDPVLDFSPFPIRRRIRFERKKLVKLSTFPTEFIKLIRELRREKYDLVIDFQGLLRSAFFAWLTRRTSGSTVGFAAPREPAAGVFYANKAPVRSTHAVEKNVELVDFITGCGCRVPELDTPVHRSSEQFIKQLPGHYILLMPGARWESKCFPPELFAMTAKSLHSDIPDGTGFILAGSPAEQPLSSAVRELLPDDFPVTDLTGKTSLPDLFELIRNADAVICNDSGPMHIAALLKTPVYSFFGPTDPQKTGPWGQLDRVFSLDVPCAKCMKRCCPDQKAICHKLDPEKVHRMVSEQIYAKEML